jgi:CRISPR-associated RAMP protein (TIGR02581 family)
MAIIRYTFRGTLELVGALHIGSGHGSIPGVHEVQTDAMVVRNSRGHPYLPGSSLRGVLRAAVSQFGPHILGSESTRIREEDELNVLQRRAQAAVESQRQEAQPVDTFDEEAALQDQLDALLTDAERLFGTVLWASPLLIPDMFLHDPQVTAGEVRHGVGIDRDTGAASDGAKYDFEVLPPGLSFACWIRCDIPEASVERWTGMLALALRLLEQGELTLGGRAARGVGQVRLTSLAVSTLNLGVRSAVLDALLAPDDSDARYGQPQAEGWTQHVLRRWKEAS